ncbi:MAG: 16S rRNA methyltransferase [Actinomycetales bacterium]|nr:MAG: 16S rRNA methyltransferase [Actinomycetales bacterium]
MPSNDHYFSATPAGTGQRRSVDIELAGRQVRVVTAGGVFSPERLDPGTAVLLRATPPPPEAGPLLDLGCGWGPIALTMGLLSPQADVYAVDINERALDLTRTNAASLGLDRVHACLPTQVPEELRFDVIWSNPPIRVGKEALHDLLATWLPRLAPGGTAYLVVNKNLGADSLHRWLVVELGCRCARLASSRGFRVLAVETAESTESTESMENPATE